MPSAVTDRGGSRRWTLIRAGILQRDRGICWICGKPGATTVDHVRPRSYGGDDAPHNLRAAHASCNYRRRHNPAQVPATSREW